MWRYRRQPAHIERTAEHVDPGRIGTARVAVLTIIDEEFGAARGALGTTSHVEGTPYYRRAPLDNGVVLSQAIDRGNVPATNAARDILENWRPEVLMLMGIAGGIFGRDSVALGDVVVPRYLHYGEMRKLTPQGDLRRYVAFDQPAKNLQESFVDPTRREQHWYAGISQAPPDGEQASPGVLTGSLVAGEKIMGNPSHHEQRLLVSDFNDAVAVDMESFGVARAVFEQRGDVNYNPRFLVVRGISDLVRATKSRTRVSTRQEQDNNEQRQLWKLYASATAAAFVAELSSRILRVLDPRL